MDTVRDKSGVLVGVLALLILLVWGLGEQDLFGVVSVEAATPELSEPGGYYDRDVHLALSLPRGVDGQIYFTLDGRIPTTENGTLYTRPLHLSVEETAVTILRARIIAPGQAPGPVVSASYFVGVPATLPLVSLVVEPEALWNADSGIYANPLQKGAEWERMAVVTYLDTDRTSGFQSNIGLRIHGGFTRTYDKKSFRLYFRGEYGRAWLDYPLFADENTRFKRLVLHSGAQDSAQTQSNWSLMRSQIIIRLAENTNSYATHSQPVLLYLNGEPWGVYQLRERIDERFFATTYNIEDVELLDTPELGENRRRPDLPRENWDALQAFIAAHDLADPAHFAYVATQVDLDNLIDYSLLQIYSANIDWPHRNMNMFRPLTTGGRWLWVFWDSDSSFGLQPNSSVDTDMVAQALAPFHPDTDGRDTLLLRSLMANPDFRQRFLQRALDLLNTELAPTAVSAHIDALAAELAPDIPHEAIRWQSGVAWEATIADLHRFAAARPDAVRMHLANHFALTGPYTLTIRSPQPAAGQVLVNGRAIAGETWSGVYFAETPVQVTAVPAPGHIFTGWDESDAGPDQTLTLSANAVLTPRFAPQTDAAPAVGDVVFTGVAIDHAGSPSGATPAGDWLRLRVERPVDLRGWRLTDNDTPAATDEGALIFPHDPALARVPAGTEILVVATEDAANGRLFPGDDLDSRDGQLAFYTGNGNLDIITDPWFNLGRRDNVVLIAPTAGGQPIDLVVLGQQAADRYSQAFGLLPNATATITP